MSLLTKSKNALQRKVQVPLTNKALFTELARVSEKTHALALAEQDYICLGVKSQLKTESYNKRVYQFISVVKAKREGTTVAVNRSKADNILLKRLKY